MQFSGLHVYLMILFLVLVQSKEISMVESYSVESNFELGLGYFLAFSLLIFFILIWMISLFTSIININHYHLFPYINYSSLLIQSIQT